ncbi:hypothetical protein [uncultured Aquimarina sp.]|uniref:hypothetical protein n=1 Tax=uncultured Aquimarina sp. TaxID=575652 RepID=UPI00261DCCE8|nr:hypothetical protein [uncultured Aquimarina sp.]
MKTTIIISIILVSILCSCYNKKQNTIQCGTISNQKIINKAFVSFENDLFAYYKLENDTIGTYKKFLSEISSMSIDLKTIASNKSRNITGKILENASTDNSLWISYYDYYRQPIENNKEEIPTSQILENLDIETEEEKKIRIQQENNMLVLNYKGPLIQCLKNNSKNNDLTKIIEKLEWIGPINPKIIADGFNAINPEDTFRSKEVKIFIAFEIYYYMLMIAA